MPRKKGADQETAPTAGEAGRELPPPPTPTLHAPLVLIEVADGADLSALLSDSRLAPLIVARLSDTAALALPGNARALLDALRKAGHTPKVAGEGA